VCTKIGIPLYPTMALICQLTGPHPLPKRIYCLPVTLKQFRLIFHPRLLPPFSAYSFLDSMAVLIMTDLCFRVLPESCTKFVICYHINLHYTVYLHLLLCTFLLQVFSCRECNELCCKRRNLSISITFYISKLTFLGSSSED